jgi:DNA segregation ATPase FtsK/SpoIIIE-like protein
MNVHRLTALLTGAVVTVVQPFNGASSVSAAISILKMAEDVTVFIQGVNGPDSFGSGVIVAKTAKGYSVLTAAHVVSEVDQYTVKTKDGLQYAVKNAQRLPGMDLAIVQFESNSTYQVAQLGNSDGIEQTNTVYVAGYPKPGRNITVPIFTITDGRVASIIPTNEAKEGYGLSYSNPTRAGMSGGPVFNEAGEVIAIHGRKEGESDGSSPNGAWVNLGIPINRFKVASAGGIRVAKTPKTNNTNQQAKAQQQIQAEAQRKAQQQAQAETQRKAQQQAQAEAQRKAQLAVEAEAQRKAQQQAQAEAQRKAQQQAQAEAQRKAQQQAQAEAQRKAQQQAQAEAQQKTQARQKAQIETQRQSAQAERQKEAASKAQQLKAKSANLLASVGPLNVAVTKQQTVKAPSVRQVCEEIRINTIVSKRCHNESTPQPQGPPIQESSSSSPESYVNNGNEKAEKGRYESAVEDYTAAINSNSRLAAAFFNRGLARYRLGQRESAISDFSKAAELFRSQGETTQYQQSQAILQAMTQASS